MREALLGLLLAGGLAAVASAGPVGARESALREALSRTHLHGIREADARAVASEDDVPLLLAWLADPAFERPDNAAAFLVHLAGAECVPALRALAARAPAPTASPERDRARLLLPRVLASVAARQPRSPARAALEELAAGPERDLAGGAAAGLERLDRPGAELPPPRLLERPRPRAADAAPRVEGLPLSFANHVDHDDPMTAERLDLALYLANVRAGRADFEEDVSCCVELERSGAARSFGSPGDGLDVIDGPAEFEAVRSSAAARVKVVRQIGHCFGDEAPNIGGCAEIGGDSILVVRFGSATVEGLAWLHEYGHNTGIAEHDPDDRFIMSLVTGFQDVALREGQCAKFHEPEVATALVPVDRGPCTDLDGDAVQDSIDNCPEDPNFDQQDLDGDGLGAPCDGDDDGDGVPDEEDRCPGLPDGDDPDGDGSPACEDGCPLDPFKVEPGHCGCGSADLDADGDGALNCDDGCPFDPDKITAGACGCGEPDDDSDGDGTPDCDEACPEDPEKTEPGACGCGESEADSDGDGTPDCLDACPGDPAKTESGACGCGEAEQDSDEDGAADCLDGCPLDAGKSEPGPCGCSQRESDGDDDGVPDCLQCLAGDVHPEGGDGVVGAADWVAARRRAGLAGAPASEEPPRCLDLAPLTAVRAGVACASGGDGFDAADVAVVRALAAGTLRLSCELVGPAASPSPSLRRPGDVAPRGGPEAGLHQVGDGRVDVADVLQLLRWAVGLDAEPGREELLRADVAPTEPVDEKREVRGDERLDVSDVLLLLRVAVDLETLIWPVHELPLRFGADAPVAAFLVRFADWPEWAEAVEAAGEPCASDLAGGLDAAEHLVSVACAWDPGTAGPGPVEAGVLRYRAPEPLPAEGPGAPWVAVDGVGPDLAPVPATW